MNIKFVIKSLLLELLIGRTYCKHCGNHVKPVYEYWNDDGDTEFCFRCECGECWHMADHAGQ